FFGSDSFNLTLGIQHGHAPGRQEGNACGISLRAGQCDAFFGRYRLAKSVRDLHEDAGAIARISLCTCRAAMLQIDQGLDALVHDVAGSASMLIRDDCYTDRILLKIWVVQALLAWSQIHGFASLRQGWLKRRGQIQGLELAAALVSDPQSSIRGCDLAVEVHLKFLRGWAQADRGNLVVELVLDVGLNEILREHVALGEELVVFTQCLQPGLQGGWCLRDGSLLCWWQLVEILIHRRVRLDAVLNAV